MKDYINQCIKMNKKFNMSPTRNGVIKTNKIHYKLYILRRTMQKLLKIKEFKQLST